MHDEGKIILALLALFSIHFESMLNGTDNSCVCSVLVSVLLHTRFYMRLHLTAVCETHHQIQLLGRLFHVEALPSLGSTLNCKLARYLPATAGMHRQVVFTAEFLHHYNHVIQHSMHGTAMQENLAHYRQATPVHYVCACACIKLM